MSEIERLVEAARAIQGEFELRDPDLSAGSVAAALRTTSGAIYTGICVDLACGIGSCAEHAAITEMLKDREVEIDAIVSVNDVVIVPPCGRCRELIAQLSPRNAETTVVLPGQRTVTLKELLPDHWLLA